MSKFAQESLKYSWTSSVNTWGRFQWWNVKLTLWGELFIAEVDSTGAVGTGSGLSYSSWKCAQRCSLVVSRYICMGIQIITTVCHEGEHQCTCGWPGSIPVGLQTFKIETQIHVSNKVQVTQICRSSTCENTSTCHLIKKSDTNSIWTSSLLHLRPVTP